MTNEAQRPNTLFGFLQPGERTTRKFSCPLPDGFMPILQKVPGHPVEIVDQNKEEITLENTSDKPSPYMVWFATQNLVNGAMSAFSLYKSIMEGVKGNEG